MIRAVNPLPGADSIAEAMRSLRRQVPRLALVLDDGPSMQVWRPTIAAFQEITTRAFEDVSLSTLVPGGRRTDIGGPPLTRPTLVVTDGLDPFWRDGAAARLLRQWGQHVPVALVNPFPQRQWHLTNLVQRPVQLSADRSAVANKDLRVREDRRRRDPFARRLRADDLYVPLLELHARWLTWWAALISGPRDTWLESTVFVASADEPGFGPPPPAAAADSDQLSPQDRVYAFRARASAEAFRLATYIAAAPLELPVLRSVQGALLPESTPAHLAEVVSSPLLMAPGVTDDGGPFAPELSFRTGVRGALLACATRAESARVMEVVSTHYGDRVPAAQALFRLLDAPDDVPDTVVSSDTMPFAEVELAVLRALSGPYGHRAYRLSEAIARRDANRAPPVPVPVPSTQDGPERVSAHTESGGTMSVPTPPSNVPPSFFRQLPEHGSPVGSINALLGETEAAQHDTVWGNVPPRNTDFTGRDELLRSLEDRLRAESVTAVLPQALHGLGGVGKSQIAIEYAYRHRHEYEVVWWIPAEQPAQILRAMMELGEQLNLETGLEASAAVSAVREALRRGAPYTKWLLIFDNAETLDTVQPYLPQGGTGKVLITSRNERWSAIAQSLEIDVFSRAESIELLRKRNPDMTVEEADQLANVLDDLPLAVGQASAWRATTGTPVAEYLRLLSEKREALAEQAAAEGYEIAVAAAWTVALERLGVESPAALQLLQVCSFFAPEPIARELLIGPRNARISPELDETLQNPSKLNRAIRDIQRYGLARIDHREQTVQLHRLVRTVVVSQLTPSERTAREHGAHVLLAGGNPGNPGGTTQWPRYHALLPHVVASDAVGCEDAWARQLVLDVIEFYYYWGDHESCRDLARQVVTQWRATLGADDLQTLKAARWLGYEQRLLGAFAEARQINADCLDRLEARFGPEDEETLDAMSLVAADHRAAGEFTRARDLDREAFDRCLVEFGPDDPITLTAAHSLGISMRLTGEFQAALDLDAETYQRRGEVLGLDHMLTLLTLNGLTLDLREVGQYRQAYAEQELVHERFQRIFGAEHPYSLSAARNLAVACRRAGYHERARKVAEDALTRLRQRFGATHPDTIAAALNFAVDLRENDELERSRNLAEQTYQEYENSLGPDHPFTLYARTNLGIVLRLLGDLDAAHEHDSTAFTLLHDRLGRDHVLTLTCATNLASDLAARGDHQGAFDLDVDTLERSRRQLGAAHPSTLACELNLALDQIALGRTGEGERRFGEVLAGYRRALGDEHPAITAALAHVRANCDVDPMPL